MNRRSFLKKMGLVGLAIAAPLPGPFIGEKDPYPDFDPQESYGNYFRATDALPPEEWVRLLDRDIAKHIPDAYRKRIKYWVIPSSPSGGDPLGQYVAYCWKYAPSGEAHRRGLVDGRDHVQWRSKLDHCILNDGPIKVEVLS